MDAWSSHTDGGQFPGPFGESGGHGDKTPKTGSLHPLDIFSMGPDGRFGPSLLAARPVGKLIDILRVSL